MWEVEKNYNWMHNSETSFSIRAPLPETFSLTTNYDSKVGFISLFHFSSFILTSYPNLLMLTK